MSSFVNGPQPLKASSSVAFNVCHEDGGINSVTGGNLSRETQLVKTVDFIIPVDQREWLSFNGHVINIRSKHIKKTMLI